MGGGMDAMMKEMMQGMGGGGGGGSFSSFSSSFSMGGGAESSRTETVIENGRRVTKTIRCVRGVGWKSWACARNRVSLCAWVLWPNGGADDISRNARDRTGADGNTHASIEEAEGGRIRKRSGVKKKDAALKGDL